MKWKTRNKNKRKTDNNWKKNHPSKYINFIGIFVCSKVVSRNDEIHLLVQGKGENQFTTYFYKKRLTIVHKYRQKYTKVPFFFPSSSFFSPNFGSWEMQNSIGNGKMRF